MFNETSYNGLGEIDWGSIIGGGLQLGSTIVGGIFAGKQSKEQLKALQEANRLKQMELEQMQLAAQIERDRSGLKTKDLLLYAGLAIGAMMILKK